MAAFHTERQTHMHSHAKNGGRGVLWSKKFGETWFNSSLFCRTSQSLCYALSIPDTGIGCSCFVLGFSQLLGEGIGAWSPSLSPHY